MKDRKRDDLYTSGDYKRKSWSEKRIARVVEPMLVSISCGCSGSRCQIRENVTDECYRENQADPGREGVRDR